jgi:pseudouridine synthase
MSRPSELAERSRRVRLHKVLADAGVGSRRACEGLITSGAVAVNGIPVTSIPAWADPGRDRITVKGRRIDTPRRKVYVMLYKPTGVECTSRAGAGRRRAIDLVRHPSGARLFAVGRLDVDSSGLLLLTNDGELANRLTHPRYGMPKVYQLTVRGALGADALRSLQEGLFLTDPSRTRGSKTARSRIRLIKRDRDRTHLQMELHEGRNRQVRRMMLRVGHPVKSLRRIKAGPLKLKGLRVGEWRELTRGELGALKKAAAKGAE